MSFAKFLRQQNLQKLHLAHRSEDIRVYSQEVVTDVPVKIKDAAMTEFIKSLQSSAREQLEVLRLAHLKINSTSNAEAMAQLISRLATNLQSLSLEQMFGKRKLFEMAFAQLGSFSCRSTLQEFACLQSDMTDKQVLHIASTLKDAFPSLKTVVCEGSQEVQDENLVEVIR